MKWLILGLDEIIIDKHFVPTSLLMQSLRTLKNDRDTSKDMKVNGRKCLVGHSGKFEFQINNVGK